MAATTRKTAEERRVDVLAAARTQFATHGFHGASTEAIARDAGISQPYLFRLFGTKKELFVEVSAACLHDTLTAFQDAADGLSGPAALAAIACRYHELLTDRQMLQTQMQAYSAACDDPEIQATVREGFGALVEYVERVSGEPAENVAVFFAKGMLCNVFAALDVHDGDAGWGGRLLRGCIGPAD